MQLSLTQRTEFPARLLVYHAGTGRTVFLGCLKVTTIFICAFFCVVMAPTHFYADEPKWVAAAGMLLVPCILGFITRQEIEIPDKSTVMLSGVIPVVFVGYISGPFVTYIHLRLPLFARHSREMLMRYSKNLPRNSEIDITTMNFIGKPRVTRMTVGELYPVKERFGMANYARDTMVVSSKRPWWMGKAVRQFGVHNKKSGVLGGEIW